MGYTGAPVKRTPGHRLSDPRDPAVRAALRRRCPVCNAEREQWCVGVSHTTMRGRRLSRIHYDRCEFRPDPEPAPPKKGRTSDRGRVRSLRTGAILSPWPSSAKRYHTVALHRGGKRCAKRIHVLVLEAHKGPRPPGMVSRHFPDRSVDNNRADNLQWGTPAQNAQDTVLHGRHPELTKTRCSNGHAFDSANTYVHPRNGRRQCRACMRDVDRRRGSGRNRVPLRQQHHQQRGADCESACIT